VTDAAPDPKPRCETCRFFWKEACVDEAGVQGDGLCRRYPPVAVAQDEHYYQREILPRVYGSDWCGEWKALPCGAVQPAFGRVCVLPVDHADGLGKKTAHRDSGGHRWFS
jgi:hypothetical protein